MTWLRDHARRVTPKAGGACVFGAILYTEEHAFVSKVLNDCDYWSGLSSVSGPEWAVFAIRGRPGKWRYPECSPDVMNLMVPVWREPADNREVLGDVGLECSKDWPLLLVFTEDEAGTAHSAKLRIRGDTIEATYASIRDALEVVTSAIRRMDIQYRTDPAGIRRAVFQAVHDENAWRLVQGIGSIWQRLLAMRP